MDAPSLEDFFRPGKHICEDGVGAITGSMPPDRVIIQVEGKEAVSYQERCVHALQRMVVVSWIDIDIARRELPDCHAIRRLSSADFVSPEQAANQVARVNDYLLVADPINGTLTVDRYLALQAQYAPVALIDCWFGRWTKEETFFYERQQQEAAMRLFSQPINSTSANVNFRMLADLQEGRILGVQITAYGCVPLRHVYEQ